MGQTELNRDSNLTFYLENCFFMHTWFEKALKKGT